MNRRSHPLPIVVGLVGIFLVLLIAIVIYFLNRGESPNINVVGDDMIRDITVQYADDPYIADGENLEAAREYLQESGIVPSGYVDNSELARSIDDSQDNQGMSEYETSLPTEHYFFQQHVDGVPVNGALLSIHVRNDNEIYFANGKVLNRTALENENISMEDAVQRAVSKARQEIGDSVELADPTAEKVIYNGRLIGVSNDNRNIPAAKVIVSSTQNSRLFSKAYYISLIDGGKLDEESLIHYALDRQIYDCNNTVSSCSIVRQEGESAVGDGDIDSAYNYFGDTYNFFSNNYQRDSYDDRGSSLRGYTYVYPSRGPNASWDSRDRKLSFTPGMVVNDITGHELAHAVTSSTAGLVYSKQSGAINEAMSDIFGWGVDQEDWSMGEDSTLGAIRSMRNPPTHDQPDKVFASNYHCNAADRYGVHYNSGVVNKAFYLMVEGDSFNSCNISSIGEDRALHIFYRTLTRYLSSNSNFKDLYDALIQSCNDLYDQSVCEQVDIALQAVEIDQQPANSQFSPACSGGDSQPPSCSSNPQQSPIPTATPGSGQNTSTPTPGQATYSIQGRVFEDSNGNNTYDNGEGVSNANLDLSGDLNDTATTLTDGSYVFDNLFAGTFNVSYQDGARNGIQLTQNQPQINVNFVVTRDEANPTPTIVPGPTSVPSTPTPDPGQPTSTPTPTPSSGTGGGDTSTPTPTPATYYECRYDPECAAGQDNIQLCPLVCTEQE